MTNDEIRQILKDRFENIRFYEKAIGFVAVVEPSEFLDVAQYLRDDDSMKFDMLHNYAAVDWPPDNMEVFALLFSFPHRHKIVLKCVLDRTDPRCPSVSSIWPAANWYEREMFDLFGIVFSGHPDLRRLFLPEYWKGHPLRKDYVDSRMIPLPEVHCE